MGEHTFVAYPDDIREKARSMRVDEQLTLDEIAERLTICRTTIWYWIKDLPLAPPGKALQTPKRTAARLRAAKAHSERAAALRRAAYDQGWNEFEELVTQPGFRDFICMYIGEGFKRDRNKVAIANSDPVVMSLADCWLRKLSEKQRTYAVQYHADQDVGYLQRFWSFRLGFEPELVKLQRKSNSNQLARRKWRSKWGVLTITVNDTYLRSRLQAWIDRVKDGWLDSAYGV